ncbi:hypothetical protein K9L97_04165 [Candidatus Woesearchaeota archaeon]|nr:hypothetical protein [Candidatus Woesearchaeota archaeon]
MNSLNLKKITETEYEIFHKTTKLGHGQVRANLLFLRIDTIQGLDSTPKPKTRIQGYKIFNQIYENLENKIIGYYADINYGYDLKKINETIKKEKSTPEEAIKKTWSYHMAQIKNMNSFIILNSTKHKKQNIKNKHNNNNEKYKSIDIIFYNKKNEEQIQQKIKTMTEWL